MKLGTIKTGFTIVFFCLSVSVFPSAPLAQTLSSTQPGQSPSLTQQNQLPTPIRSSSGQFIVYGETQLNPLPPHILNALPPNWVRATPTTIAIACERIKQALLWQLNAADKWQGKVYVMIRPTKEPNQMFLLASGKIGGRWYYQLDIPDALDPDRFVRALVNVLLIEWINRVTQEDQAYPPSWLVEGFSELIIADNGLERLVPSFDATAPQFDMPITSISRQGPKPHVLAKVHSFLATNRVLSLAELITPTPTNLVGADALIFRYSSQLLVYELLQLKGGSAALCNYLDNFAAYRDPSQAILNSFARYFTSFKEFEQWWILTTAAFTVHDLATRYTPASALEKIQQIMSVQVLDDKSTNSTPQWRVIPLQTLLLNWTNQPSDELVRLKISQLETLRWRTSGEVALLIQQYIDTLRSLLGRIDKEVQANQQNPAAARAAIARLIRTTVRELDTLDEKRAQLAKSVSGKNPGTDTNQSQILKR